MASPARKLTTHQQAVLIQVLLAFPGQRVALCCSPSALDAPSYAENFRAIFNAVGWSVKDAESAPPAAAQSGGLALVVGRDHRLPPGAEALRDALRIYGIEVEAVGDPSADIPEGSFVLSIGAHA